MARSSRPERSRIGPIGAGGQLDFTRPGEPTDNGHIESFNGRLRDDCVNVHQFMSLTDTGEKIQAWRRDYNQVRPHSSLGDLTPSEFIIQGQDNRTAEAVTFLP